MKKATLLVLSILMFGIGYAQNAVELSSIQEAPGTIVRERTQDPINFQRDEEIWSEDFDDGIPSNWEASVDPSPAAWEYRGSDTSPDNSIGTRGSCIQEGLEGGAPILSPSLDNGFVIFDSNYWDDEVGPCGSFGTGQAPGPHHATLTTPTIDLSAYDNIGLSFYQYHKNFDATTTVEASIDGGEWIVIWQNDIPDNNGESALDEFERKNVSSFIGGEEDVRLRFVFDGNYYFWMLDDITLFELNEYILVLRNADY
ncbi:MAG: hypothetical protein HRT74_02425, partial [Flavobacteriales bacterium]|nr:hypothetical protein [Flavobacteriales bacterium]